METLPLVRGGSSEKKQLSWVFRLPVLYLATLLTFGIMSIVMSLPQGESSKNSTGIVALLVVFCVLSPIFGLLAFLQLRRQILSPLLATKVAMDRVAAGELQVRAIESGAPEVSTVTKNFNFLATALQMQAHADEAADFLLRGAACSDWRGTAVFDENLRCLEHNEPLERLTAIEGNLVGRHLSEIISLPEIAEMAQNVLTSGLSRQRVQYFPDRSGSPGPLCLSLLAEKVTGGGARVGLDLVDPTERSERAQLEALQIAALASVAEAVIVTDRLGRIHSVNAGFQDQTGYSPLEAVGQTPALLRSGEVPPIVYRDLWETITRGEIWRGELINRRKDGSLYPAALTISPVPSAGGAHTHYVSVARDLTEDRKAKANFQALIEAFPDAIGVHQKGRLVFANSTLCHRLGYTHRELLGRRLFDIVHPGDRQRALERTTHILETGESGAAEEERVLCKSGEVLTVETTTIPVEFEGRPSILVVARDITTRRAVLGRLMASDRLAAAGTLAAGVGHEINNPLSFLSANLEFIRERIEELEDEHPPPEVRAELLDALCEAGEGSRRIADIVSHLRAFAADGGIGDGLVKVEEALQVSLGISRSEIRHRAALTVDIPHLPMVTADVSSLSRVFTSLLTNAAQAIAPSVGQSNWVRVSARALESWVEVDIEDSGQGIAPEDMVAVFDPFFTTRSPGEGTGLGLSISRKIIEELGGSISIRSTIGEGTCVTVRLPAASKSGIHDASDRSPDSDSKEEGIRRPRLLVVDDDPPVGRSLQRVLSSTHEVVLCREGRVALERIAGGEEFDVILCDLMMPDLTGMALAEVLEESHPEIAAKFLFITGGAFTAEARQFAERHADRVLRKPFDLVELRSRLSEFAHG